MDDTDDSVKKMKNAEQDIDGKAETKKDLAEGKLGSETLNKAKNKVKDALTLIHSFFIIVTIIITNKIQNTIIAQYPKQIP